MITQTISELPCNGIDLHTGLPVPPLDLETLSQHIGGIHPSTGTRKGLPDGTDPNNLAQCRWGVVVHAEHTYMLHWIEPLMALRAEQQGETIPHFIYHSEMTASAFLATYEGGISSAQLENVPYYLVILGEPNLIPFSFQCDLNVVHAVGRLAFTEPEDYTRYATNVVAVETAKPKEQGRMGLCFSNTGDSITRLCKDHLVEPMAHSVDWLASNWCLDSLDGTKASLLHHLTQSVPDLLWFVGHGVRDSGSDLQRREDYHGSLICSDFQRGDGFSLDQCYTYLDALAGPGHWGQIVFLFTCYSGGTPVVDITSKERRELHPYPFVASLSKAMLQRGALAVVGHVDQAFWHSFFFQRQTRDINHFKDTFRRLQHGTRVGHAMEPFYKRYANLAALLGAQMFQPGASIEQIRLQMWIAFHDARNYLLLGDPAVRAAVQ